MDSTKYYEELAEMGLILSNMASVGASSARPKKWTNNNVGETYTANNLDEYMYYLGMEHRINHMNENVPYMLGQHDTIALLGKVSNLERNVITLVIGENENYKDILAVNYDGSLGVGSGDDIHHQGYDYYANQIYEQLVNYDNSLATDRWKTSYWIVGYGTGGSIANLVAKKFIDYKHVNTNIYCYTYQAPGTINRNNIPSGKKIHNTKYYSIFNHINTDDPLIQLESEDFDRYGRDKKVAAGYSNNFYDRRIFDGSILYNNQSNSISRFLMDYNISNDSDDGLVSGFSLTEDISKVINKFTTWLYSLLYRTKTESEVIEMADSNGELEEGLTAKNINSKYKNAIDSSKDAKYQKKVVEDNGEIRQKLEVTSKGTVKVGATLKYLDELAVWYVNHVATYGSKMKGKYYYYDDATTPAQNHLNDYATVNINANTYVVNDEDKLYLISNKQLSSQPDGRLGYKYDTLEQYANEVGDNELDQITITTNPDVGNRKIMYAGYAGDDCNSFTMAVIRLLTKGKRGQTGLAGNTNGIDIQHTSANDMVVSNDFEKSMLNLGFHKYYFKDNEHGWKHKYIDVGGVVDKETTEVNGIGFLQPGDILVCKDNDGGHVEFYNGFTYNVRYNDMDEVDINSKKKSGIESISFNEQLLPGRRKKPGDSIEIENTGDDNRAYGTFSWGRVRTAYPTDNKNHRNYYFYFIDNIFRLCYSCSDNHAKCDKRNYTVIWRKD